MSVICNFSNICNQHPDWSAVSKDCPHSKPHEHSDACDIDSCNVLSNITGDFRCTPIRDAAMNWISSEKL